MSSFTDPLAVEALPDCDEWVTLRAFSFWYDCDDDLGVDVPLSVRCRSCVTVPAGTRTDFATIPRVLWSIVGHPAGRYKQAAVLHDYLYRTGSLTRARCDELFREGMAVLGVPAYQRWLMWAGVRIGGALAYAGEKR